MWEVHLSGSACHWPYTVFTQLRFITTLIIAMGGGGSYCLKRGVRKKGGSREPPEPPLATGLTSAYECELLAVYMAIPCVDTSAT